MLVLSICWVMLLLGLLYGSSPDSSYPREIEQRVIYYGVWLLMLGLLVNIHYRLMAHSGHGSMAVLLDVSALGLFIVLKLLRLSIRHLHSSHSQNRSRSFISKELRYSTEYDMVERHDARNIQR